MHASVQQNMERSVVKKDDWPDAQCDACVMRVDRVYDIFATHRPTIV